MSSLKAYKLEKADGMPKEERKRIRTRRRALAMIVGMVLLPETVWFPILHSRSVVPVVTALTPQKEVNGWGGVSKTKEDFAEV